MKPGKPAPVPHSAEERRQLEAQHAADAEAYHPRKARVVAKRRRNRDRAIRFRSRS